MKRFTFTLASELESSSVVVIGVVKGKHHTHYYPWSTLASAAARAAGDTCGCGICHNCEILNLYRTLVHFYNMDWGKDIPLDFMWEDRWAELNATRNGGLTL